MLPFGFEARWQTRADQFLPFSYCRKKHKETNSDPSPPALSCSLSKAPPQPSHGLDVPCPPPTRGWQESRSPGICQCHLLHLSQMHPAMVTGAHMVLRNLEPSGKGIHSSSPHHRTTHPELRARTWGGPITYRVFPQLLPKWRALLTSAQVPGNCKGRKASVSNRHHSSDTPLTT